MLLSGFRENFCGFRTFVRREIEVKRDVREARKIKNSESSMFDELQCFCIFVGQPRSGHSLVGALLNAHPNIVIAHERDILSFVGKGAGSMFLYSLLVQRDRWFNSDSNGEWTGYSYVVPNQYQGKAKDLRVIGDKKGGETATKLYTSPEILDALHAEVGLPLKIINHVRNPFDCIATQWRRMQDRPWIRDKSLESQIELFFQRTEGISRARSGRFSECVFDTWHEELVAEPRVVLKELISFLGEDCSGEYLTDCSSVLFVNPKETRNQAPWTEKLVGKVESKLKRYDFLSRYKWDG